jgi:hypothetical protein
MAKKASVYKVVLTTWSLKGDKATSEVMFKSGELVKALPVFTTLERECHYGQVTLYRDGVEFATGKAPF